MKPLLSAGLLLAALVLAACSGASAAPTPPQSIDPNAVAISARDIKFSTDRLAGPAGKPFQIAFDNQDGAPHNVSIYTDSGASRKVLVEEPFGGPKTVVYQVPSLAAGRYFFRCDVHPDMKGVLQVQ